MRLLENLLLSHPTATLAQADAQPQDWGSLLHGHSDSVTCSWARTSPVTIQEVRMLRATEHACHSEVF